MVLVAFPGITSTNQIVRLYTVVYAGHSDSTAFDSCILEVDSTHDVLRTYVAYSDTHFGFKCLCL